MPVSGGGMGRSPNGPNPLPKWKRPKKGTKTVSAVNPRRKRKKKKVRRRRR